jgi:hypothetical protein
MIRSLMRGFAALGCFGVLTIGCSADYQGDAATGSTDQAISEIQPTGKGIGVRGAARSHGGGGGNGISYHGGPVMTGTVPVYYIWYGNWSGNSATTLLPKLVGDLSGSGYEHINTTYSVNGMTVSGTMTLAGQTNDNYSRGTALSDADIQTIVQSHCADFGGCNANSLYFVLTTADVNETSGFCTQYCGWHNNMTISGANIKYAFVGNADRCPSACAAQTTSPNGNAGADAMASIIAHESEEAISDPDGNAWYDTRGYENGDKCAWTFGTESTASNGSKYNFAGASGTKWLIQQNWVNANGGYCAMSY